MLANPSKSRQSVSVSRHGASANGDRSVYAPRLYLKQWRLLRGYTLEEAGARVGVHFTTIDKWERDVNRISFAALQALGRAYDVPPLALALDPHDKEIATRLIHAHAIIVASDPEAVDKWLLKGVGLKPQGSAKRKVTPKDPPPTGKRKIASVAKKI